MTIKSTDNIIIDGKQVYSIHDGNDIIYKKSYANDYFYIQNDSDITSYINIIKTGYTTKPNLSYSRNNGSTWTSLSLSSDVTKIENIQPGDKILFKGSNSLGFNKSLSNYYKFGILFDCQIGGNLMSIVVDDKYKDMYDYQLPNYCFEHLFDNTKTRINAKKLTLTKGTKLQDYTLYYLFSGCTNLIKEPEFSTVISNYNSATGGIFSNCSSLTNITIPIGYTIIGSRYISNAESLEYIISKNTTPPTIQEDTFYNIPDNTIIYVPDEALTAYQTAANWTARAAYIKPISEKPRV